MPNQTSEYEARRDYEQALNRAFWRKLSLWLGRGCNDLLPYGEVFQFLRAQPQTQLGLRAVRLTLIVGSSGRFRDFDLAYNPRRDVGDGRWVGVASARRQGIALPPVLLYRIGEAYFVEDGNHRVSVARARGESTILARVTEIDVSHLQLEPKCTRLGYKLDSGHCRPG